MAHAQTLIDIQRNLYKRASDCHVASIAILNRVIHGHVEGFKVTVLDGIVKPAEIPGHKAFHQCTLLSIDLLGHTDNSLHFQDLMGRHRPIPGIAGSMHDMKPLGEVGHQRGSGRLARLQRHHRFS